jgi:3',5'-cyclic AMP phosphodiesterase CpdA
MSASRRVAIVSDSHLSPRTPEADANWDAVIEYLDHGRPDLVLHAGDLSLNGAGDPADLEHARARLDDVPIRWLAIPGNHDIGDNPGGEPDDTVNPSRLERWLDLVGADHWAVEVGGWLLLGINAQLFGTGLAAEAEQWEWIDETVGRWRDQPIALLTHKPVFAEAAELTSAPWYRFCPPAARDRLSRLLEGRRSVVISGHVHQYRQLYDGARFHVWAPTTWGVLPDEVQPTLGVKRCGVLTVDLTSPDAQVELVEPPGLAQLTIGRDMPDPYQH